MYCDSRFSVFRLQVTLRVTPAFDIYYTTDGTPARDTPTTTTLTATRYTVPIPIAA
jgi:Fn3 associated